jgi:uncharacterized protein involved in outer membrane biogenesis
VKTLFKWAFRLLLLFVALVVAFVLLLDTMLRVLAERNIRAATGMDVRIGKLELGLLNARFTIQDFRLYNTAEFGGSPLVEIPELHMEYDRSELASGRLRFKLVRFNLAELNVVQSKDGKSNIDTMLEKVMLSKIGQTNETELPFKFAGIDTLNITLGKVRQTDMNDPSQPVEVSLDLKNEILTGIRDEQDFQTKLLALLMRKGAGKLMNQLLVDPSELFKPAPPPKITPPSPALGTNQPIGKN